MKFSTIVAAVAAIATLTGTSASAGPVGVAIQLSSMGYPFHHGQPTAFMLEGSAVTGMYPGISKPMSLRVKNPYPIDLKVTHLAGKVEKTNRRACKTTSLVAERYAGSLPLKLKAKQSKSIGSIPIRMPTWVTNECAGVTYTIRLYGTATKVNK